jgi:hypothetical protein
LFRFSVLRNCKVSFGNPPNVAAMLNVLCCLMNLRRDLEES